MDTSGVRLFPIIYGLLLGAGCGKPVEAPFPLFIDPPILCNAALLKGPSYTLVTKQLILPKSANGNTYTEDYDGDSRSENQLKNLVNVAMFGGFDLDAVMADDNQAGRDLLLIEVTTPDLGQADCAQLTFQHAQAPGPGDAPPKFDGTDMLKAADAEKVTFYGRIDNFLFQSLRPRDQQSGMDPQLTVTLPLSAGETIAMRLHGVGIFAILSGDNRNQLVGLTGAVHGVQAAAETADELTPAVAQVLTTAINTAPSGDFRNNLIKVFEIPQNITSKSKCMVPADCCALMPATCKILPEEVTESVIGGILAPDVEVFDDAGNWKPIPRGHQPNGFSMGLGFAAVPAVF